VLVGVLLIGFGVVRRLGAAASCGVRSAVRSAAQALLLSQQFGWIGSRRPSSCRGWWHPRSAAPIAGLTSVMSGGAAGSGASEAGAAGGAAAAPTTGRPPLHRRHATVDGGGPTAHGKRQPHRRPRGCESAARGVGRGAGDRRRRGSCAAHARMDAPEAVVAGDEFLLIVGLAPEPVAGVINPQIVRPESSVGPYTLDIQVVADGFSLTEGEWRRQLPVTAAAAYPTTTYKLRADGQPADVWSRPIQALYSIEGQTVGVAIRTIAIVAHAELSTRRRRLCPATASVIAVAPQKGAPDLRASRTAKRSPTGVCCGRSDDARHPIPPEEIVTDVGRRPQILRAS
jgi:hypothetical protein